MTEKIFLLQYTGTVNILFFQDQDKLCLPTNSGLGPGDGGVTIFFALTGERVAAPLTGERLAALLTVVPMLFLFCMSSRMAGVGFGISSSSASISSS
jgi:high-affinity Fe2+/Pb2+ permease